MNYKPQKKKKSMSSPYQEQRDNGQVDRQMTEGWINGWVDERMDALMDGYMRRERKSLLVER